uniref:hypothetical protein n=1 Tax=Succinivibrio sp. TaxID=2053619 RepID=UPI003FEECD44
MKYLLFILCFVSFSSHAIDTWGILNSFDLDQVQKELKVINHKLEQIDSKLKINVSNCEKVDNYDYEDDYVIYKCKKGE